MDKIIVLSTADIIPLAAETAKNIQASIGNRTVNPKVYGIPLVGVSAAYAVAAHIPIRIVDNPNDADLFIDGVIDSGKTAHHYGKKYGKPVFALVNKQTDQSFSDRWVVFPWESPGTHDHSGTDAVTRLLQLVGEDKNREGLLETPHRVVKAWKHWCSGYHVDIPKLLKTFEDGGEAYDQMVIVKDIPIYSKCEHHMADIFGTATIAYIPNGRVVGLSKLSRLADAVARRLQVQERLTQQIADALDTHLQPVGVGVLVRARHMCMESRGICQQGHHTITTALRGAIKDEPQTRSEFLRLANTNVSV